ISTGVPSPTVVPEPAASYVASDIAGPSASERLVQQLRAEDLAQEHVPNIFEQRQKELDALMM
nr:hypothetical protein [Tanacetum cinerariifolium]